MAVLVVAATSARLMAEAAVRDGFGVVALDLFGDTDTRHASPAWEPIGHSPQAGIDKALTVSALQRLARRGDVIGWVAGAGFEDRLALLRAGAEHLPLIGTAPDDVQRVRDPRTFFALLDRHGIAHPEVSNKPPADPGPWLLKGSQGSGGWQVRRAARGGEVPMPAEHYAQRESRGVPMSATFIANGSDACVLGFNRLLTQRIGERPFVFAGVIGPVPLPPAVARQVSQAVRTLASGMHLRGLGSLDFLFDGEHADHPPQVLEVNARPPASLGMYAQRVAGGVMAAHVRACLQGVLPSLVPLPDRVDGSLIVYAPRPLGWDAHAAAALNGRACVHDLPLPGARFAGGDPVCSLSAVGSAAGPVTRRLQTARKHLLAALEESSWRQTP